MKALLASQLALLASTAFIALPLSAEPIAKSEGAQLVDDLHSAFGQHHARAVHAKGIVLVGMFEPTLEATQLSRASLFLAAQPVTLRFSNFTGFPDIPDNNPSANPRGLAIQFGPPGQPGLDVVAHNFNGFPTRTAAEFGTLLRAIGSSGAGAGTPTQLDGFLTAHPVAKTFLTSQHPAPVSYATTAYFGVNAVTFTDAAGKERAVRYRFVPAAGEHYLSEAERAARSNDYLQDEIAARVTQNPVRFDWYVQIAQPGDAADDPSVAWPEDRQLVKLGTITLRSVPADQSVLAKALAFNPGRMPDGIKPADPMLAVRAAAYPISVHERQ